MPSPRAQARHKEFVFDLSACQKFGAPLRHGPSFLEVAVIDLHCHILPGIDDGAKDITAALEMARLFAADGVTHVACTPHILPGVYPNHGAKIRQSVAELQGAIRDAGIDLHLLTGADNHMVPDFVTGLSEGRLLTLADSRYVLVEPPHHVAPPRLEEFFFSILMAGYVPVLTHPERLTWIEADYAIIARLVEGGVWMQLTAGSLAGRFGSRAKSWAFRMLEDGLAHILATDSHDPERRPPNLSQAWALARDAVGAEEAERLVLTRPFAIVTDAVPATVRMPAAVPKQARADKARVEYAYERNGKSAPTDQSGDHAHDVSGDGWISRGLRGLFSK